MLTRLKVSGFKNLVDVDVRFGPFTCIAGANGTGKSNLFDAIRFLSALADQSLIEAAQSVRSDDGHSADIRNLFLRVGDDFVREMTLEAEMIVPPEGWDDLGQHAQATITFLRYSLTLEYRLDESHRSRGALRILKEELERINLGDAHRHLKFPHVVGKWRDSVVMGRRRSAPFISTVVEHEKRLIRLHQDGGSRGSPQSFLADGLPRTVLSSTNALESPTALLARREMQSWRLLQLEPSCLRRPDRLIDPTSLGSDGSHLPATLDRLARDMSNGQTLEAARGQISSQIGNRLAGLLDDVRHVWVELDETRDSLTAYVTDRNGTSYPAQSLSDGTLRFLALAVLELDPEFTGILCLEEPENGIHPARIPAMLQLLQDIAADVTEPAGEDNPLRQVIINTHSPVVVQQVPDDSLLVVTLKETVRGDQRFSRASFAGLEGTWRDTGEASTVPRGDILVYLNPVKLQPAPGDEPDYRRVVDRDDMRQLAFPFAGEQP
jgi:predicted ATPase